MKKVILASVSWYDNTEVKKMRMSEAKYKANMRYFKKAYERIAFAVRRDAEVNGDYIRSHAEAMGESMNSFIKRAVVEAIERDNVKMECSKQ